jgi:hypothetical protein
MNGAVISASAQRHTTVDTSTTEAELTECFKCGQDVMGFRNLMEEVGLMNGEPTLIYQDNTPASDPDLESEGVTGKQEQVHGHPYLQGARMD